jgi:hypothetical protein
VIETATVFDWLYNSVRWTWHDPDGYNFISGPLADITLLGGAYAILRRHNCHAKGCWRIGRHKVAGTDYIVCRKHHPNETPTAGQILAEHHEAVRRRRTVVHAAETVVHGAEQVIEDVEEVVHRDEGPPGAGEAPGAGERRSGEAPGAGEPPPGSSPPGG